ncbi:ABC transporter permease [Frigoribacterium sp. NBH87]|uniref:ABC transporter permease n=1 Tax=Frigoribacterium sp. NBH87 TaxID=2596916 RepID=UPI00162A8065|nr:ABC transporter permease [Frigoribacterium sp. NBH87]
MSIASAVVAAARIGWSTLPEAHALRTAVVRIVVVPVLTTAFYLAVSSGGGLRPVGLGDAVAAAVGAGSIAASVSVAEVLARDRHEGTLVFLVIASRARVVTGLGRVVVVAGVGALAAVVGLSLPLVVFGPPSDPAVWWGLALVVVTAAPASLGVGCVLGSVSLRLRDSLAPATVAEYALPLLCGVVVSVGAMPPVVGAAASALPLTHVLEAGRSVIDDGLAFEAAGRVAVALALGLAWAVVGAATWRRSERRARSTGGLDATGPG